LRWEKQQAIARATKKKDKRSIDQFTAIAIVSGKEVSNDFLDDAVELLDPKGTTGFIRSFS
jgi:hypothetical protein